MFFLLAALEACALLGNLFSRLFHYRRTEINPGSWQYLYVMGYRLVIYITAGYAFSQLGRYATFLANACHGVPIEKVN